MSFRGSIPNIITSMNALSGTVGVVFALQGRPDVAFLLMLAASVFDFSDGLAARLLGAYSDIGKELDSLCDMVSFGVLPSVILYETMLLGGNNAFLCFIPLILAVFSALRLAKFNVDTRQGLDFIGVATPSAALLCGSLGYAVYNGSLPWIGQSQWFIPVLALVLSFLLVSEIPMFGMKVSPGHKLLDGKRVVFLILALAAAALTAVLHLNWSLAVFFIFGIYILENIFLHLFRGTHK